MRAFAGEYKAVYAYLLQVTQRQGYGRPVGGSWSSPYAFEDAPTDDGELLSATYQHNYVLAQVEPQEIQSRAELEANTKGDRQVASSLEKLGSDPEMAEEISRTYAQSHRSGRPLPGRRRLRFGAEQRLGGHGFGQAQRPF